MSWKIRDAACLTFFFVFLFFVAFFVGFFFFRCWVLFADVLCFVAGTSTVEGKCTLMIKSTVCSPVINHLLLWMLATFRMFKEHIRFLKLYHRLHSLYCLNDRI